MKHGILIIALICLALQINNAQSFTKIEYSPADSVVTNPERGWYKYSELYASAKQYAFLDTTNLKSMRKDGYTLLYRIIYLDAFKSQDISSTFLANINRDFDVLRLTGVKVILRFAYTANMNFPIGDAPINIVLRHIEQLKPLLQENADVIMTLQAGFIGAWGEWYYTDYYSNPTDSANWSLRAKIIAAEMDALPKSRMIQIRYVPYLSKLAKDTATLLATEAYSGTLKARLAHHNDCFVADQSNFGTYTNIQKDRSYLQRDSKYMVVGGETCNVNSPYSDCPNSINDLASMHWTFLNIDYHTGVYAGWKTQGCIAEVWRKLGYRYRLLYANVQDSSKSDGVFNITIKLMNDGYSNPVNPRKVELILRNKVTKDTYFLNLNQDIRLAKMNDTITLAFSGGIPVNIAEGNYEILLNMPDPETRLYDNPKYSIRMANNNSWESSTGYNLLNHILCIKNNASTPIYTGNQYFLSKKKGINHRSPNPLNTNAYTNNVIVYWGVNNRNYFQVLERSTANGAVFIPIVTLKPGVTLYNDKDLTENAVYKYRMYLTKIDSNSLHSDTVNVTTANKSRYFVQINSDNSIDKWNAIQPVTSVFKNDSTLTIRFFNNTDSLFFLTENVSKAKIYFKTDDTGLNSSQFPKNVFNYKISEDSLYFVQNNKWILKNKIKIFKYKSLNKYSIAFVDLPIFDKKADCLIGVESNSTMMPDTALSLITKVIFPTPPQKFAVTNNPYIPNTSLYLSWNSVAGASSYVVERSDGNSLNFTENQEVKQSDNQGPHIDLNLDSKTVYYYRVFTINDIYRSVYSDTLNGKPLSTGISAFESSDIKVFPNPVNSSRNLQIIFSEPENFQIDLFNIYGNLLYTYRGRADITSISLAQLHLLPGNYILKILLNQDQNKIVKLIVE